MSVEISYDAYNSLLVSGKVLTILRKRKRNDLYLYNKRNHIGFYDSGKSYKRFSDVSGLGKSQIINFLGQVSKQISRYIVKSDFQVKDIVRKCSVSIRFNNSVYEGIDVGTEYYNIDINSAWWQSMYLQGIISKSFFERYYHLHEYKGLRQIACGICKAGYTAVYVNQDSEYKRIEISEDKRLFSAVYENTRIYIYNMINDAVKLIRDSGSEEIGYNQDSISVLEKDVDLIKGYFRGLGVETKTVICKKLNEYEFLQGRNIKKVRGISKIAAGIEMNKNF